MTRILRALALCLCLAPSALAAGPPLYDLKAGQYTDLETVTPRLAKADLVHVGELHDRASHHAAQLAVIKALAASGARVAVGLEMFQHKAQGRLDAWVAGETEEAAFVPIFAANWGQNWLLYRDIFRYCRDRGLPMVGLNVPRELTRKVFRHGFASLTREELGELPPVTCDVTPAYGALLKRVLGDTAHGAQSGHGGQSGDAAYQRFCEAQMLWDSAMGYYAGEYAGANPGATLVVLSGGVHAWKQAMPRMVARRHPGLAQVVLLPEVPDRHTLETVTLDDCDFLLLGLD